MKRKMRKVQLLFASQPLGGDVDLAVWHDQDLDPMPLKKAKRFARSWNEQKLLEAQMRVARLQIPDQDVCDVRAGAGGRG